MPPPPARRTPPATIRTVVSWSSGKDSAYALHVLRADRARHVVGLVTTVSTPYDRVSMHGVRRALLEQQARATGLPVHTVEIPSPCSNTDYERAMRAVVDRLVATGVQEIAFGDLFLEDIRAYRTERLAGTGLRPIFPLWGRSTSALAHEILRAGFDARVVCVDPRKIDRSFAGRRYDGALLAELPPEVDPCGENGEFHTCVVGGPVFRHPIPVRAGPIVEREGFVFADLIPRAGRSGARRGPAA